MAYLVHLCWEGTEDRAGEELVEYPGWEEGHGARRVNIKELIELTKNRLNRESTEEGALGNGVYIRAWNRSSHKRV